MANLTINGVEVPCMKDGGLTLEEDTVGAGLDRAQDGSPRNNYQDIRRRVTGKTTWLSQDDGAFIGAMLKGLGDHYTFDSDASSDKGLAPSLATGFSITTTTPAPRAGSAGALLVDANAAHTMTFTCAKNFLEGFTLALWVAQSDVGGNAWHHYVVTVTAAGGVADWVDGVYQGSVGSLPWLSYSLAAGTITLKGRAAGTTTFDDMLVIPAHASEASPRRAIAGLYAFMSAGMLPTPWPRMTVGGNFHPATMTMEGKVSKSTQQVGSLGASGYQENLRQLEFELWE